jgi:GT2 family glycosyltransferase
VKPPKVYIIILNWNNYIDSKKGIESLLGSGYQNYQILVVDNGSTDNSGYLLREDFPDLHFIFNDENLGFARGCNVGIRAALQDRECGYVLLFNNDAEATSNFLQRAVDVAEAGKNIGLVGGKILCSPECKKIWYAGGYVDLWRCQGVARGWGEVDQGRYDRAEEVDFVTGALMLIRREVLEKVGLLPEEYFFGVEEFDYSVAVKRAGYALYYVPEFLVYHRGDGSHGNYDPKYVYIYYRQKLIFMEKYLPKGLFPFWKIVFRLYGKFIFKALRTKNILKHHADKQEKLIGALDDLRIAMMAAVADHGKNYLSEETMKQFDHRFKSMRHEAALTIN